MVVIGSGAIGVEFSTIWSAYGVDVTIVEMLPRIVPLEDEEVSKELEKEFKKRGIKIMTSHKVEFVEATKTGVKVKVSAEGKETVLEADQALVAIGFRPNSKGLGLEEVGVKISERGFVEVNEKMQTNVPGIWAVGDVTGKLMLAHVGSTMGIVAAEAHRRTRDCDPRLRNDAARHVFVSAGGFIWAHRSAGKGTRLQHQSRAIPLPGERQGAWAWAIMPAS